MGAMDPQVTIPGCYGRALALWLRDQLVHRGVAVGEVLPAPLSRLVVDSPSPVLLWGGATGALPGQRRPDAGRGVHFGLRRSQGCIRTSSATARSLVERTAVGTPVRVPE
jgi:hypothetical protein